MGQLAGWEEYALFLAACVVAVPYLKWQFGLVDRDAKQEARKRRSRQMAKERHDG